MNIVNPVSVIIHVALISFINTQCLTNVAVREIRLEEHQALVANITWDYVCDRSELKDFNVYYTLLRYKSCSEEINRRKTYRDSIKNIKPYTKYALVGSVQDSLAPFAEYEFEVKARKRDRSSSETQSTVITTPNSPPAVRVKVTGVESSSHNHITFKLEGISDEDCDNFNGDLGFIRYEMRAVSAWSRREDKIVGFVNIHLKTPFNTAIMNIIEPSL